MISKNLFQEKLYLTWHIHKTKMYSTSRLYLLGGADAFLNELIFSSGGGGVVAEILKGLPAMCAPNIFTASSYCPSTGATYVSS